MRHGFHLPFPSGDDESIRDGSRFFKNGRKNISPFRRTRFPELFRGLRHGGGAERAETKTKGAPEKKKEIEKEISTKEKH